MGLYTSSMVQRRWIRDFAAAAIPFAGLLAGGATSAGTGPQGWGAARFGISYEVLNVETPCPPTERRGKVLICQAYPDQELYGIQASWYLTFRDDRLIAVTFRQNMGVDRNGDPSYGGAATFSHTVADIERRYGAPGQLVDASRHGRRSAEWAFSNGASIFVEQRSAESPEFVVYSATPIVVH